MPCRVSRLLQLAVGSLLMTFAVDTSLHAQRAASGGHVGVMSHPSGSFSAAPRSFMQPGHGQARQIPQTSHRSSGPTLYSYGYRRRGVGYRTRYPYFYSGYPGLLPFGYGLPFGDSGLEDSGPPAPDYGNEPPMDYGPEVAASEPPIYRPAYLPQAAEAPVHPQPATTLVFSDGRPSIQVHNYALTGSTLSALDGDTRQEIPLSQLDLPATIEANHKAGVDFALPTSH